MGWGGDSAGGAGGGPVLKLAGGRSLRDAALKGGGCELADRSLLLGGARDAAQGACYL